MMLTFAKRKLFRDTVRVKMIPNVPLHFLVKVFFTLDHLKLHQKAALVFCVGTMIDILKAFFNLD